MHDDQSQLCVNDVGSASTCGTVYAFSELNAAAFASVRRKVYAMHDVAFKLVATFLVFKLLSNEESSSQLEISLRSKAQKHIFGDAYLKLVLEAASYGRLVSCLFFFSGGGCVEHGVCEWGTHHVCRLWPDLC